MKKLMILLLLALLTLSAIPAAATPLDELTTMAQYFPADAPYAIAVRIDDGYIETLDGLLNAVDTQLGGALFNDGPDLLDALDQAAAQLQDGGDFQSVYRSWLGDTILIGSPSFDAMNAGQPPLAAVAVTDTEAAEAFLDNLTAESFTEYEKTEADDYILYSPDSEWATPYLLRDGVILANIDGSFQAEDLLLDFETSLADDPDFTAALDLLPESDYNIAAYFDLPALVGQISGMIPFMLQDTPFEGLDVQPALDAIGPLAVGFTILDGQSLTMDAVQGITNPDVFSDIGLTPLANRPPLNLDLLGYLPADTALFVQDYGFGTDILFLLDLLENLGQRLDESGFTFAELAPPRDTESRALLDSFNFDDIATFARLSFEGMTGLTIEETYGWMSEDYIAYARLVPSETMNLSVDAGTIVVVTDGEAASTAFDAIVPFLEQNNISYTMEGDAIVITTANDFIMRNLEMAAPELDLMIALTDEVLVAATRPSAEFALSRPDGGLPENESYQRASEVFLPDANSLWYIAFDPIAAVTGPMAGTSMEIDQINALLSLFESTSISTAYDGDGNIQVRAVLTLK